MNFSDKYKDAPTWQKERFERISGNLDVELNDKENSYLLWLAGWDKETEVVFTGLFQKLKI